MRHKEQNEKSIVKQTRINFYIDFYERHDYHFVGFHVCCFIFYCSNRIDLLTFHILCLYVYICRESQRSSALQLVCLLERPF